MGNVQTRTYAVEIEISAESEEEAIGKLEALSTIEQAMKTEDLVEIAAMIEHSPDAIPQMRRWIDDPPIWLKPILPMLKKLFRL